MSQPAATGKPAQKFDWQFVVSQAQNITPDYLRVHYINELSKHTGRNVIAYYSGWCQKQHINQPGLFSIDDDDTNGLMNCISGITDKKRGLDLILHTPGGVISATEAIVHYLRSTFDGDIRVFVPHLAMSAGTMISLSCKEVWMGKHSSLGPIDPQINGVPAHGILEEFKMAQKDFEDSPARAQAWMPILGKYHPTLIESCQRAIQRSETMVRQWLVTGMLQKLGTTKSTGVATKILSQMAKQSNALAHDRHFHIAELKDLGLEVRALESDEHLQNFVMGLHHAFIYTFNVTPALKIIEGVNNRKVIKMATK